MPSLAAYQDFREVTEGIILRSLHTPVMKAAGLGTLDRVRLGSGIEMQEALESLRRNPVVEFAEPNYRLSRTSVSNDPAYLGGLMWGTYSDDLPSAVGPAGTTNTFGAHAEKAWQLGYTGSQDVIIGVIDEGLQIDHPDLATNVWVNPFEIPGDGVDNDGNGYRDDIHGWDTASNDNSLYDGTQDDHGTHVAGTIGAIGGNGIGVAGMAWNVKIIGAKFFGPNGGSVADAVEAIDYLTDLKVRHGIRLVATNNSWGSNFYSQAIHDAVIRSAKADILFIAAAGNSSANTDTSYFFPANANSSIGTSTETAASFDNVISVAALTSNGTLASFSNYGSTQVDLAAPGAGIYSTMPGGSYGTMSGTSMAAPHVAGAVALLASLNLPDFGAEEIKSAILNSVTLTPALAGKTATGGRLNVADAIQYALESQTYLRFDQAFYEVGQKAIVESRDALANDDPSQIDQLSIWVQSTSEAMGKELVLQETSPNSSIFVGSLDLVSGPNSASGELIVATGDSIVASRAAASLQSTSVVRGATGSLISGSQLGDTFVATYTGTGTTNQWNVTRNGQTIFSGALSNEANLWIEGLEGKDNLLVEGGAGDNQIIFDANRITVDGFSILVSRIEKVRIAGGAGNDRLTLGDSVVEFDGGTGTDRLRLVSGNRLWNITGVGIGVIDSSSQFTSVEWALGGSGNDSFLFASAGTMPGGIAGGDGSDLIDLSGKSATQTINLAGGSSSSFGAVSEIERIAGGLSNVDQLIAPNTTNLWTLNGIDSGVLNGGLAFESFENLTGGSASDLFQVAGSATVTGTVNGAGGSDQLDLSDRPGGLEFRLGSQASIVGIISAFRNTEQVVGNGDVGTYIRGSDIATSWSTTTSGQIVVGGVSYSSIGSIVGGNGIDTLTGPVAPNRWTVRSANAGAWQSGVSAVSFSGVENLTGNSSADTFVVESTGTLTGTINGGAGVDELNVSARTGALDFRLGTVATLAGVLGGYTLIEQVLGNAVSGSRVAGANVATSWAITPSGQIVVGGATYSSVGSIVCGTATDTLTGPAAANRWTISGTNTGLWQSGISAVSFSGVENLTGNSSADTFVVESIGTLTGTINGGAGVDELNVSARTGALDFRLGTVATLAGVLGGYTLIEQVLGNAVSGSRVAGANVATSWAITPSGQIVVGGATYSSVGSIVGGTATDTLTGPAALNDWSVTGMNAGWIQSGTAIVSFSGVENLVGNTSIDHFRMEMMGSLTGSLQGGAGLNSISYASWTNAVVVNLASTLAGNATAIAGVLSGIQIVVGGAGDDILTSASVASVLVGLDGNDQLTGAGQRDLLVGGLGVDRLVANSGDDILISGTIVFEQNVSALRDIHSEWTSARTFDQRVANLMGTGVLPRLNGESYLNKDAADSIVDTVFADLSSDMLTGGSQQDWFFADLSEVVDLVTTGTSPDRRDG
jgi:subtilisin family serine protease